MAVQKGKNFISVLVAVVLLGAWFSGQNQGMNKAPVALAQTSNPANSADQASSVPEVSTVQQSDPGASGTTFDEGYRAGYRDAQQDCSEARSVARTRVSSRSAPRVRVAGARYYAEPRKNHSTRNMILRIAAPAAIGAGIGAIAGGKRGAGAGALIGGGGGALYHLLRHRND
jgi:hypothetical protein